MESDRPRLKARQYVDELAAAGRQMFSGREAQSRLKVSSKATALALNRLGSRGLLASPARGFYVVVPPEYRSLGCLPPEQFIPDLMKRLGRPYYVGLLSAAEYHAAAHQRPQALQVFLEVARRPIVCGRVRVMFLARKHLRDVAVQTINTPRGGLLISTAESTALDLVGYEQQAGGLNLVATVLSELGEKLDPIRLAAAAEVAPVAWAQRLGYLLEHLGFGERTGPLREHARGRVRNTVPLAPSRAFTKSQRDATWKVYVNAAVEPDL